MSAYKTCEEHRKTTLHRIHRIQGQVAALERDIQLDNDCEHLLTQAIAIEKAVGSLILHMMERHLDYQVTPMFREEPERVVRDVKRLFELVTR